MIKLQSCKISTSKQIYVEQEIEATAYNENKSDNILYGLPKIRIGKFAAVDGIDLEIRIE